MPKPYTPDDHWARKARDEGYRARSVYKLMELDLKFRLLKPGMHVLDLGAAPGSWLQYAAEKVGPEGVVIGTDLTAIEPLKGVRTFQADITDRERVMTFLGKQKFDIVLSDAAPLTSGVKDIDQWKSVELCRAAVAIAERVLKPKGTALLKIFRGADYDDFLKELKRNWKSVNPVSVKTSRDRSREIYLVLQSRP